MGSILDLMDDDGFDRFHTEKPIEKITKEKAIKALSLVLENWIHGGDADCIIAEFEEKLNNV